MDVDMDMNMDVNMDVDVDMDMDMDMDTDWHWHGHEHGKLDRPLHKKIWALKGIKIKKKLPLLRYIENYSLTAGVMLNWKITRHMCWWNFKKEK